MTLAMKKDTHPKWYPEAKISCACGHEFGAGATVPEIKVEICSQCHPFYTGQEKLVDTAGRVEKFEKKMAAAQKPATLKARKKTKGTEKKEERPKTLKEMLGT